MNRNLNLPAPGSRAALIACSNGLSPKRRGGVEELKAILGAMGIQAAESECLYAVDGPFSGTGAQRARALEQALLDEGNAAVFDLSGGDLANEILPELDFEVLKRARCALWGYSDLTCVLNALYSATGKPQVLWQAATMTGQAGERQQKRFSDAVTWTGETLFQPEFTLLQGDGMEGIVVGGNIRCFLKLAGTPWFPDLRGKLLLLESFGGTVPQMVTYLSQLKAMGAFRQVSGILLGTFTRMEEEDCVPTMQELVLRAVGPELPVAKTAQIGHGPDSRAMVIGQKYAIG